MQQQIITQLTTQTEHVVSQAEHEKQELKERLKKEYDQKQKDQRREKRPDNNETFRGYEKLMMTQGLDYMRKLVTKK